MAKRKKPKTKEVPKAAPPGINYDAPRTYKRGIFGRAFRYSGVFILLTLNVAMTMSLITRAQHGALLDPFREGIFFVFLFIIDALLLLPLLFEANRVETTAEHIRLYTLFWRRTLNWDQVVSFEIPKYFKFSILKTGRCFYLINKYDLKPFDELASTIEYRTSSKDN